MGSFGKKVQDRKSSKTRKVLLEGGSSGRSWVLLPPRTEKTFLERWFSALSEDTERHKRIREFDKHWEYQSVVADLKANFSSFCQNHYAIPNQPHVHFQRFLWRELRTYSSHLNRVVEINRGLRDFSKILSGAHKELEKIAFRARLGTNSAPLIEQLSDVQLRALELGKNYWDRVFCIRAFAPQYPEDSQFDVAFPAMRRLSGSLRLPEFTQERNLDSIFQIRIGDLLRDYGRNPYGKRLSLLTISRLVLLVYICAELASDIDGNLTIWGSNPPRTLTVAKTYEALGDAGLH